MIDNEEWLPLDKAVDFEEVLLYVPEGRFRRIVSGSVFHRNDGERSYTIEGTTACESTMLKNGMPIPTCWRKLPPEPTFTEKKPPVINVDKLCKHLESLLREGGIGDDRDWNRGFNTGMRTAILNIQSHAEENENETI